MSTTRRQQLETFLRDHPGEAFARYGLAMDYLGAGETDAALAQFRTLHEQHPDYVAGFHQAGQLLLSLGRFAEARAVLERGIAAAQRAGDQHARSEIEGLLLEIQEQTG